MATEAPDQFALERFDDALDEVTHATIGEFEWLGLPDSGTVQRTDLLHRLNDAIAAVMREWL